MKKTTMTVSHAVALREAVWELAKTSEAVYVRKHGSETPVYRVVDANGDPFTQITTTDLFYPGYVYAPVTMESVARAMIKEVDLGLPVTEIDVFTIKFGV